MGIVNYEYEDFVQRCVQASLPGPIDGLPFQMGRMCLVEVVEPGRIGDLSSSVHQSWQSHGELTCPVTVTWTRTLSCIKLKLMLFLVFNSLQHQAMRCSQLPGLNRLMDGHH